MRKLIYFAMISLDGYIARPDGSLDWVIADEQLHRFINDRQAALGGYVYGRRMYELMAAAWPPLDDDPTAPDYIADFARLWQAKPKIVFSQSLQHVEWNARLARSDATAEVARLKSEPGKDLEVGGAALARTLMQHGLVDEYQLFVQPALLGRGIRPFPIREHSANLALQETRAFGSGVVYLRYACNC